MMQKKTFNRIRKLTVIEEFKPEAMEPLMELAADQFEVIADRLLAGDLINPIPFPDALPFGFRAVGNPNAITKAHLGTKNTTAGLLVMASLLIVEERVWYHVSFSREHRLPSYADLRLVKQHWFGAQRWAIQIFPPSDEHVNIDDFCLHLWHCLDDFPMPSFSIEGQI